MPSKINFLAVEIIELKRNVEGGSVALKCPLTQSVIKAMGWVQKKTDEDTGKETIISTEIPDYVSGTTPLDGELLTAGVEFMPTDDTLKKNAMDLSTHKIDGFKVVRLQSEKSKAKAAFRRELRFTVHFSDENGAAKLERFMQAVPKCKVYCSYEKQAVQEDLPEVTATKEQQEAVAGIQ